MEKIPGTRKLLNGNKSKTIEAGKIGKLSNKGLVYKF